MTKINLKSYRHIFALPFLTGALLATPSHAEETPPSPPKRPDILHVSPEYIKQLRVKHNIPAPTKTDKQEDQNLIKSTTQTLENEDQQAHITQLTSQDIVQIIEPEQSQQTSVPLPTRKPDLEVASIEPSAPATPQKSEKAEKALVSFTMMPKVTRLDNSLKGFLESYALKLFNENPALIMEIQAYATPVAGEQHSDVRISLARALEVRSFLIDNNIAPDRLKLQPNGQDKANNNDDRIDIIFIEPQNK